MARITRFGMVCLALVRLAVVGLQLFGASPTLAATISSINIGCQYVTVRGKTEVNTSYVRVQVVLASNLSTVVGQQVVRTRPRSGASYVSVLDIRRAHLAQGTLLVVSVGEWDGSRYLRPATLTSAECGRGSEPPTPPPVDATPTPLDATPTQPPVDATPTQPPSTPTQPPIDPTPTPRR